MKYELDWSRRDAYSFTNHALVGILTGNSFEEIETTRNEVWRQTRRQPTRGWYGQSFIKIFQQLGFNTSWGWIKFDPNTDKPCIMRTTSESKGYWNAWIYQNGVVNNEWTLEEWKKEYDSLKITSMLQVWI